MTARIPLEPLVLLQDEPVSNFKGDQLGIEPFARVIAGAAVGTDGPFTIGVFANWGEGKTSLLKQAKTLVDEYQPEIVTVWFNAWQYEKEEHPIVPLVASIVRAVDQKLQTLKKSPSKVKTALSSVSRALRAIAYGFSAKAKVGVPGFPEIEAGFVAKEMIDRYEKLTSAGDPLLDRTLYYNAFETLERVAAEQPTGEAAIKIVVFIDDLDRCLPPQSLKLLESIKLVLAQRGFIFALAVDRGMLESFVAVRYQKEYGIADYHASGTQYLDKIVQLPLALPPHRARFQHYIQQLLDGPVFKHASNELVRDAVKELVDVLAAGSNYNPRNLVRFLNNLIVDREIWASILQQQGEDDAESELDAARLGLCAVSRILRQHLGDSLYRWLVGNKEVCNRLARDDLETETPKEEVVSATLHERSMRELMVRLDEAPFLRDLLGTDSGKSWLTDHEPRQQVDEFLVEQREKEEDRRTVEQRALHDDSWHQRASAFRTLAEKWPDETTRKLLAERAVQDEHFDPRAGAIAALAAKWPDESTRKLLVECAVQDENFLPRFAALGILAEKWPNATTRTLLEERAVQDAHFACRSIAITALGENWRDETTRKLLAERAVHDEHAYARGATLWALGDNWPDETTRKLLKERAVDASLTDDQRTEHYVALGRMHSEFGRFVLTKDFDGRPPYLDPREPISREHIERAAEKANVPADKIDETVQSLSDHLGWNITQGSGA